jgi:STE24 endopeptidase
MSAIAALVAAAIFFQLAVESGLVVLNVRHVARAAAVPPQLAGVVDAALAERTREYTLAKARFGLVHGVWSTAVTLAVLFSGVMPWLDGVLSRAGLAEPNRFVAFLAILGVIVALAGLPFALYGSFVLEERFGFNRTSPGLWLKDRLKGVALAAGIGIPLLYAIYFFMAATGAAWWIWVTAFLAAVQIVMVWLYPTLIAPLFNEFKPLPDGPLRERLERLASDAGFHTRGIFVMDASRRSGHSNAYFVGFFRPRIVLFDTLVQQMSVDEAAAVLAHEIGHYKARHIHKRLALGVGSMALTFFILSLLLEWPALFSAFGFSGPSRHAALALFSFAGGAFTFLVDPFWSWLSRRHEFEADRFSARVIGSSAPLRASLLRLNGENLSNLNPHPWYSAWHYSHPPLVERLAALSATGSPPQSDTPAPVGAYQPARQR